MNSSKSKKTTSIFGIVHVNDKGQVVIPAEARAAVNLESGDKLLVMVHPSKEGIVLIKPDGLESFANQMLKHLSDVRDKV
ncbi:MAG: AbrB/MazE/SpoVT family DNA-binding domain-containing protein [Candidatus Saccharibacteria bacterium]